MTLLECKDLIKIYPSPIEGLMFPALRGLDLSINQGDLISIIGPSGAGKSTLLRLLSGFDMPSSGEVWFNGQLVNQYSDSQLNKFRQKVGIMYQSPRDNLIWNLSALDNVLLPIRYSGKHENNQKEVALKILEDLNLIGKENRKPSELSGGEAQRVSIAVALANKPQLLLADEPTGELDSYTTSVIIDYFKKLKDELGLTIIVVTHDKRFARMTDKTYKIQDGRLTVFHDTKDSIINLKEEIIIVDSHGNLRLPREVIQEFKGLKSVKISVEDDRIILIPFNLEGSD